MKDGFYMSKRYFTDSDKLGRKKYADFLRNIIDNSEKYQRDKLQESYVIAVEIILAYLIQRAGIIKKCAFAV